MKLSIKERITLLGILPQRGDFVTLSVKFDISRKVAITQDEMKEIEMVSENTPDGNILRWNQEKEVKKEVEFTESEKSVILDSLKNLDSSKSLNDDTFQLYKMIKSV